MVVVYTIKNGKREKCGAHAKFNTAVRESFASFARPFLDGKTEMDDRCTSEENFHCKRVHVRITKIGIFVLIRC